MGRTRRLRAAGVALGALALPLVPGPVAEASAGADCGTGADSPPAITMASGSTCHGTHDGETPPWPQAQYDVYQVAVTDGDHLAVSFQGSCPYTYHQVSGSLDGWPATGYVADGDGWASISVRSPYYTFDGGTTCASEGRSTDYSVTPVVTPNDRPVIDEFEIPSEVLVGIPYDVRVAASDNDANLEAIGVASGCCGVRGQVAATGAGAEATVPVAFTSSGLVWAFARDGLGAESVRGSGWWVTLTEDDCGTGGDVGTFALGFSTPCRAYLSAELDDESDTFTFDATGAEDRARVLVSAVTGGLTTAVSATSPSGADVAVDALGVFPLTEPGTWSVTVARTGATDGAYDLEVVPLAGPQPPDLVASISPTSTPHVGEPVTLSMTATDLGGLPVRYEVDWGDGTTRMVPPAGWAASGETRSLEHEYWDALPATVTVTAVNTDGLRTTWSHEVVPHVDWDRCRTGDGADRDAPDHRTGWADDADGASFSASDHLACDGSLGRRVPATCGSSRCLHSDGADLYRIRACALGRPAPCELSARAVRDSSIGQVELTVTTSDDLAVAVDIGSTRFGTVPPGSTMTFRTDHRVLLGSATDLWLQQVGAGAGTYALDVVVHHGVAVAVN